MQWRAFLLHLYFYDFLGVIPSRAGVRHEDGLVESEDCNRDQITDKEKWLDERKGEGGKEDAEEDIEHASLRVLCADLHDLFAVLDRSFLNAFELNVGFDELDCAIGAGRDGLGWCACEPVNDRAAGDQAEHERRMKYWETA